MVSHIASASDERVRLFVIGEFHRLTIANELNNMNNVTEAKDVDWIATEAKVNADAKRDADAAALPARGGAARAMPQLEIRPDPGEGLLARPPNGGVPARGAGAHGRPPFVGVPANVVAPRPEDAGPEDGPANPVVAAQADAPPDLGERAQEENRRPMIPVGAGGVPMPRYMRETESSKARTKEIQEEAKAWRRRKKEPGDKSGFKV